MISDENTWMRLWGVLDYGNGTEIAYIYRLGSNGKPIKPFLRKYVVSTDLPMTIQRTLGGGKYWVMIRDRRKLVFSGGISVCSLVSDTRRYS